MIKNIYGYVYDYSTGVMTSYPNSIIELHSNDANEIPKYYMVSTKVYDTGKFEVESTEGVVHHSTTIPDRYTVWFNNPSPSVAKMQIFNYIFNKIVEDDVKITKELDKIKSRKKEVMEKFGIR